MSLDFTLPDRKKASIEANQLKRLVPEIQAKVNQHQVMLEEVKSALEEFNQMESMVNTAKKNIYLLLKNKMVAVENTSEFNAHIESILEQWEQKADSK